MLSHVLTLLKQFIWCTKIMHTSQYSDQHTSWTRAKHGCIAGWCTLISPHVSWPTQPRIKRTLQAFFTGSGVGGT
jgi:hypothetical protein